MGSVSTAGALCIFAAVLIAYTIQTELAQVVQSTQGYRKPYFLFYLTHSGYTLLAPLHLITLRLLSIPIVPSLYTLRSLLEVQFAPTSPTSNPSPTPPSHRPSYSRSLSRASLPPSATDGRPSVRRRTSMRRLLARRGRQGKWEWAIRMAKTVLLLSVLIALPALSWYAAMPLTAVTDITALYNCFAFWAYLLAIRFLGEPPTRSKLASVLVAILGVFVIAYGDSWISGAAAPGEGNEEEKKDSTSRLAGDLLAFFGSISYAWYEVWYKMNVALPDPDELDGDDNDDENEEGESLLSSPAQAETTEAEAEADAESEAQPPTSPRASRLRIASPPPVSLTNPTITTFLLYSNSLTSLIGITTLLLFWIPIPILHFLGWEPFEAPPSYTLLPIVGIVLMGVVFNAGFMVLLSLWGPVVASVGNLLTLMMVALADALLPNSPPLSWASILGSGLIVLSFGGLILDAQREAKGEEEKARQAGLA